MGTEKKTRPIADKMADWFEDFLRLEDEGELHNHFGRMKTEANNLYVEYHATPAPADEGLRERVTSLFQREHDARGHRLREGDPKRFEDCAFQICKDFQQALSTPPAVGEGE